MTSAAGLVVFALDLLLTAASLLRELSTLLSSKIVEWCTKRSMAATVMPGSGNTLFQPESGWLAVMRMLRRS